MSIDKRVKEKVGWLAGFKYRRTFEFKMKNDPLLSVSKGCPKGCGEGYHVDPTDGIILYLHGMEESFPDGVVFTKEDGITLLKQHLDHEVFRSKDNRNPPWDLVWVKFAIDRYDTGEVFKGYIYYGKER